MKPSAKSVSQPNNRPTHRQADDTELGIKDIQRLYDGDGSRGIAPRKG